MGYLEGGAVRGGSVGLVEDKEGIGFEVCDDFGTNVLPVCGGILSELLERTHRYLP